MACDLKFKIDAILLAQESRNAAPAPSLSVTNGRGGTPLIGVIVIMQAKPGQKDALLADIRERADDVRAEQGCRTFHVYQDGAGRSGLPNLTGLGEDAVVLQEIWEDDECFRTHLAARAASGHAKSMEGKIQSRSVHLLSLIE